MELASAIPVQLDEERLAVFAAPGCSHPLKLLSETSFAEPALLDAVCGRRFPIRWGIPRFVSDDGYAASFGEQWNRFRKTQLDRFNGTTISRDRFFRGTGWDAGDLVGQRVLDAGCGAGRFTQVLLDAGAEVYALDLTSAVEACWANNGPHPRLCVAQADLYAVPFRQAVFDKVLCYGTLQHTPDPRRAFLSLVPFLRSGGEIAIDVYLRGWRLLPSKSKYLYRWLTKRMPHDTLFRIVQWYVPKWLPIDTQLKRIPKIGPLLGMLVPCWNYSHLPLTRAQVIEWGVLDTFDALSPTYDVPQTIPEVRSWFEQAGLVDVRIREGGNGILANGRKPS